MWIVFHFFCCFHHILPTFRKGQKTVMDIFFTIRVKLNVGQCIYNYNYNHIFKGFLVLIKLHPFGSPYIGGPKFVSPCNKSWFLQNKLNILEKHHHSTFFIMHPPRGPKGRGVANRQREGCISIFAGVFSLNFITTHTTG